MIGICLSIVQTTTAPGGTYIPYYKCINTIADQIPAEEYNFKKNFLKPEDSVNGFKITFKIKS